MITTELQNYVHLYSMFSFGDGRTEAGIVVSKYNIAELQMEYYFIHHNDMKEYKEAFDIFEMDTCNRLSHKISTDEILNINPVSLKEYKAMVARNAVMKQDFSS